MKEHAHMTGPIRVLILCTGNSARSQMAEGLLRHDGGASFEVFSAGVSPTGVRPEAVAAMREIGVDISGQPITITLDGRALVLISCPADRTTACRGTVTIRAAAAQRAGASVRLKDKVTDEDRKTDKNKDTAKGEGTGRVLGKSRYRLQPGQSQKLGVKLSRNGRHRVLRGRRVRCSVNVGLLRAGGKVVSGRKVILKAPKRVAKTVGTKGR